MTCCCCWCCCWGGREPWNCIHTRQNVNTVESSYVKTSISLNRAQPSTIRKATVSRVCSSRDDAEQCVYGDTAAYVVQNYLAASVFHVALDKHHPQLELQVNQQYVCLWCLLCQSLVPSVYGKAKVEATKCHDLDRCWQCGCLSTAVVCHVCWQGSTMAQQAITGKKQLICCH